MMALLRDHSAGLTPDEPFQTDLEHGKGICVHYASDGAGASGNTAASLVADLCSNGARLPVYWCNLYSPCLGVFFPLFSEGDIPAILSRGGEKADEKSPWWLFYRLSRAVREDPQRRVPAVRAEWEEVQAAFHESAYRMAGDGRRLLEEGQSQGASQRLTEYMSECASTLLAKAGELLARWS